MFFAGVFLFLCNKFTICLNMLALQVVSFSILGYKKYAFLKKDIDMKSLKNRFVSAVCLSLFTSMVSVFGFVACGVDSDPTPEPKTSIVLNTTSVTAGFNSSGNLIAVVSAPDDLDKTVSWTSSNSSVVSLPAQTGDSVSFTTGSTAGNATITVKAGDTSKTISVTVKEVESAVSKVTWNAGDYSGVSDGATLGIMTAIFGSKTIDANGGGLKFSGSGSMTSCALKFSIGRSAKITITRDTNTERTLALYNGTQDKECTKSSSSSFFYNYTNSGASEDLYIYSTNAGITIYSVTIEYTETVVDTVIVYPDSISLSDETLSLDDDTTTATLSATISNASSVTSGYDTVLWLSSDSSVVSVSNGNLTAKKDGSATIYATTINGLVATCTVSASGITDAIRPKDIPTGYAGENWVSFYDSEQVVTVTTKSELVEYAKKGGWTIYVSGMIDLSEGMLPSGTSGNSTSALDAFVAANSDYSTYSAYNSAKLSGVSESADWTNPLNNTYRNKVRFSVASKTAIIGLGENSGVSGGGISIGSSYVVLRNLVIKDGYDPFPNHEANDGWNAQIDAIGISGANHVWVDHCTLEDTIEMGDAPNASNESSSNHKKFQTYDGLCDINNTSTYVTVSNCILRNHDKTMLIGSGSSDKSGGYITLSNNRFYGCGQRLPLTCYANMHILNNYYGDQSGFYSNSYAIGARYDKYTIIAEGNYFGSGISDAFKASTTPSGSCYARNNSTNSGTLSTSSSRPFIVPYSYDLLSYSDAKDSVLKNAGAGVWAVKQ